MIRVLVLIAISGFLAGVVALAGAAALGGPDLATRHWDWVVDWDDHRDGIHRDGDWRPVEKKDSKADATRELSWDGATKAVFELRADIDFTQAPGPGKVTVMGPKDLVDRVRLSEGRFSLDGAPDQHTPLRIVITAPSVTRFEIGGDDRLDIHGYKQEQMTIVASGASEVEAKGEVGKLDVELSGSGEADLSDLISQTVTADISGSAQASLAPKERASLEISGSGEVKLATRPAHLETDIAGAGTVTFEDGGRATDSDAQRRPERRSQET